MKSVPEGYSITFQPRKQGTPKWETFLVPKKPEGAKGPNYYSIMSAYLEAINFEIVPNDEQTLWWQGRLKIEDESSYFAHQPMGINEMRQVPNYMATVSYL